MDYKKYQNVRNATWKILIDQHISELPVPVVQICHKLGIKVKYDPKLTDKINSGQSMIINGKPYILVAPDCPLKRMRFTIAHELGHIILGHVGEYQLINRAPSSSDNSIEQEANIFASRLLAPACILWGCKVQSPEEISKLCDISLSSAEHRYERYCKLLRRNRFISSPLERAVFEQFSNFIQEHQQDH